MRFYTITLADDDTPVSLKSLIETSLGGAGDETELLRFQRKFDHIQYIAIYPEDVNDVDATNGPARVGSGTGMTKVDRVIADAGAGDDAVANGFPLLPGIMNTELFKPIGSNGVYNSALIFFTGKTGDVFQIGMVTV
jgi:hypothetical protein